MDDYYLNKEAEYYVTVVDRNIKFHDSNNDDPDWKLKQCVLLLVKGVKANGTGIDQFWRSGTVEGNIEAADFGQYFDKNAFTACVAVLPFMWSDKNHWYRDRRDKPWELFTPFIEAWNARHTYHLGIG